jgi:catalase (peroxidase I)
MAMNDEETVALIAGGTLLVKYMVLPIQSGPEPAGAGIEEQDLVGKQFSYRKRRRYF